MIPDLSARNGPRLAASSSPAESSQAARGAPIHQRVALLDASQTADAQSWVAEFSCRQISAGSFTGLIERTDLGDIEIVHEQQSQDLYKVGATPNGQCTISLILSPAANTQDKKRFTQFADDSAEQLFFLPEQTEFDVLVPGGIATCYVRVDQAELLRELALLNEPLAERLAGEGNLTGLGQTAKAPLERSLRALLALARDLDRDLRGPQPDGFSQTLREYLLLAVSHSDPDGGSGPNLHARRRSLRIVRRAQACMDAQASQGDVPRVGDLCAAAGVSERTLQHAFREQLGLAPGAYLRMRRLNGARAELLAPTASTRTITEVAARWGFLHMGRFTRAYRDLFGELPSTTLARSLSN